MNFNQINKLKRRAKGSYFKMLALMTVRKSSFTAASDQPKLNLKLLEESMKGEAQTKKPRLSKGEIRRLKRYKSKTSRESGFIKSVSPIFNLVINNMLSSIPFNVDESVTATVNLHNSLIKNHGIIEGTRRFADIRTYAIGMLEGQNPANPGMLATGKKDLWPSLLNYLRPLFFRVRDLQCRDSDQAIRSILHLNRLCQGNNKVDISSITLDRGFDHQWMEEFREYVKNSVKRFDGELLTHPSYRVLSSGPNSKPKWMTADVEAYALINSELHESFKGLCMATGNGDLYEYVKARAATHTRVDRIRLRYITGVADKGNKSRVVAIGDYWTSVLLEPIMYDVQEYNRKEFDTISYSHDHSKAFENVKLHLKVGDQSYDFVDWTNAFTAVAQFHWMEARYGKPIAQAWFDLVVKCKWDVKGFKFTIVYGSGQGMGVPCSFDVATATDLCILKFSYKKYYNINLSRKEGTKVGDDLHCYDPQGYILRVYTKHLNMEVQTRKSKTCRSDNYCAEIVSRNINYGRDVSRISANICRSLMKNVLNLPTLMQHLEERGYSKPVDLNVLFKLCRVRDKDREYLIRTLYLVSVIGNLPMMTDRHGCLLKDSILFSFGDFIASDNLLTYLRGSNNFLHTKHIFYVYCACKYIESINEKIGNVFDACSEFDSSDLLLAEKEPEALWKRHEYSIEYLTSTIMLAESFANFNEMYAAKDLFEYEQVLELLEGTERRITFKKLGIISNSEKSFPRQRTTKLFNFVKSLSIVKENLPILDDLISTNDPLSPEPILTFLVKTNLSISFSDPIFNMIRKPVKISGK
jgi:hypothetical protein